MRGGNSQLGLLAIMAMIYGQGGMLKGYNPPDADDKVISPPQSEESKKFYLIKAEEKRKRKNMRRKL